MNRAESAALQYRVEADAKVLAKKDIHALHKKHKKRLRKIKATTYALEVKVRHHEKKDASVQQFRREANTAVNELNDMKKRSNAKMDVMTKQIVDLQTEVKTFKSENNQLLSSMKDARQR